MPQGQELIILPTVAGPVLSAEMLAGDRATALFRAMRNSDSRNYFICDFRPLLPMTMPRSLWKLSTAM